MTPDSMKIKVALVDDNQTVHQEIGPLLRSFPGIQLVASGYNGHEAIQICEEHQPEIVLMDVSMPIMNGIMATQLIMVNHPAIKIIAMSGIDDTAIVEKMIAAGAAGYVLKEAHPNELESTIRAVHSGKAVFSSNVVKPLLENQQSGKSLTVDFGLTDRELQVLTLLGQGQTNVQIAHHLSISQPTVRFHLNNILEKLNVQTRSEALVIATRNGLI